MGKKKKGKPKIAPAVQFRAGEQLEEPLREFADHHNLSLNDAARRLVAMALNNLGHNYYGIVEVLAEAIPGNPTFAQACFMLAARLEQTERERFERRELPLTVDERWQMAKQVVFEFGGEEAFREDQRLRMRVYESR